MNPRARERLGGLLALVSLLGLLLGPPIALAHFVGWPLPTRIPSFDEMNTAARSGLDDMVVVKALAVLAWLCWLQLALAALVETAALIRGRAPRRAPVLPVVQIGVGRLVAAAALVVAGLSTPRAQPVPMARLAAVVAQPSLTLADAPPAPPAAIKSRDDPPPAAAAHHYLVRKNDSWWGIAERALGDGERWKELRSLNVGQTMRDGATIEPATEIIRPGWELLLPPGSQPPAPAAPVSTETAGEAVAQPGDNLWDIAHRHLHGLNGAAPTEAAVRDYWVRLIEANRDRLADPDNPSRIYAGQRFRLPPAGVPANAPGPIAPAAPPPPTAPADLPRVTSPPTTIEATPSTTAVEGDAERADTHHDAARNVHHADAATDTDDRVVGLGLLGAASTLLAVGISGAVVRRRRRRQLHLPPRTQPPLPPPDLDALRADVAAGADMDQASRLHRALRDIATALAARHSDARPRVIQVTGQRIEALLSQPVVPAPSGWRPEVSGSAWVLDGQPADDAHDGPAPSPALVSLGRPEDGAELYLDLEAEGLVALVGDIGAARDIARSWILELATSPLSAVASIAVVGEGLAPAPEASDRVRIAETWDEIATDALAWAEQSTAVVAANQWLTPTAGRVRGQRLDDLAPLVLIMSSRPVDQRFDALCQAIGNGQPAVTVVVVGDELDGATRVEVSGRELQVPSLGLTCLAQAMTEATADDVNALLADASRVPTQLELIPTPARRPPVTIGSQTDDYHDPPFEILVRLLGDIAVIGGTKKLKPKQTAVVAYIALSAPVASERVEDALWVTPTSSRHKRLANTVSETRTALGAVHLPAATDGRYRVGAAVVTDIELFERRLAFAAEQPDEQAVRTLRGALELVEGPVFTYRNADRASYVWVDVDNWHSTWELNVTDAAEDLAQRCLDLGDIDGAIWAARRGLNAAKVHPRLTKLLIEAHFAKDDHRAAEQVFESHQAALDQLELDDVDPELLDFYQAARRARGAAAS